MIQLPTFTVALDQPDYVEHTVQIRGADQMMAEQAAARLGIDQTKSPMQLTYLWCYAALKRLGHFTGDFTAFQAAVLGAEALDETDVDPTQTGPASTSL